MTVPRLEESMIPLCVNLEGALVRTDLEWEMVFGALKKQRWLLLLFPFLLLLGKHRLLRLLARRVEIDATTLPYTEELLTYLRQRRIAGQPIILVAALPLAQARAVSDHIGIFKDVISFSGTAGIEERQRWLIERYGAGGFDYAGTRASDARLWQSARIPILVNTPPSLVRRIGATRNPGILLAPRALRLRTILLSMRPDQWVKNLLLFIPVLAAHRMNSAPMLADSALAFVAFSLAASSNYLFNDLFDLASDRNHPRKRHRPLAAAEISLPCALTTGPLLLLASLIPASRLPVGFLMWLALYLAIAWVYSLMLRQYVLLDVVALACLYTIRVAAGGSATGIRLSFWLLAICLFIFTSLALAKRCSELINTPSAGAIAKSGRDYDLRDLNSLSVMGVASGYMAILVIALYVNSPETAALYSHPMVLWFLCPLTLFWISRLWILVGRGQVEDDPVAFALRDAVSLVVVVASLLTLLAAL